MTLVFQAVNWVHQGEVRTVQREAVWLADDFIPQAGGDREGLGEVGDPCVPSLGRSRSSGALRLLLPALSP